MKCVRTSMERLPHEIWGLIAGRLKRHHMQMFSMSCRRFRAVIQPVGVVMMLRLAIKCGDTHLVKYILHRWPHPRFISLDIRGKITWQVAKKGTHKTLDALCRFPLLLDVLVGDAGAKGNYDGFVYAWERLNALEDEMALVTDVLRGGNTKILDHLYRNSEFEISSDYMNDAIEHTHVIWHLWKHYRDRAEITLDAVVNTDDLELLRQYLEDDVILKPVDVISTAIDCNQERVLRYALEGVSLEPYDIEHLRGVVSFRVGSTTRVSILQILYDYNRDIFLFNVTQASAIANTNLMYRGIREWFRERDLI